MEYGTKMTRETPKKIIKRLGNHYFKEVLLESVRDILYRRGEEVRLPLSQYGEIKFIDGNPNGMTSGVFLWELNTNLGSMDEDELLTEAERVRVMLNHDYDIQTNLSELVDPWRMLFTDKWQGEDRPFTSSKKFIRIEVI
tara:strand:+ start:26 stop:445 length:420 start_codon:yes stop_codon:yes gene_type:complete